MCLCVAVSGEVDVTGCWEVHATKCAPMRDWSVNEGTCGNLDIIVISREDVRNASAGFYTNIFYVNAIKNE